MPKNVLSVKKLNVKVDDRELIHEATFDVPAGFLTCVTGENGVGKTTLMKTLLKQRYHNDQHVQFKINSNLIQYVPQFRNVDEEYPLKVKDFIVLGRSHSLIPWLTRKELNLRSEVLAATDLKRLENEPMGRASGGEKQRAYLAQALMSNPELLILDETTASLDKDAKITLLQLVVNEMHKHHMAVMFITHDPSLIQRFGDYDLHIEDHHATMNKLGGEA